MPYRSPCDQSETIGSCEMLRFHKVLVTALVCLAAYPPWVSDRTQEEAKTALLAGFLFTGSNSLGHNWNG